MASFPVHLVIDMSDVRSYIQEVSKISQKVETQLKGVVAKGAVNIKEDMRANMGASSSFGHLARAITYDLKNGDLTAEIGMVKKMKGQKAPPRRGGNIAYFGTSKGGGGREDPIMALKREIPNFEREVLKAVEGIL